MGSPRVRHHHCRPPAVGAVWLPLGCHGPVPGGAQPALAVPEALFRLYGSLNDFLPAHRRQVRFRHAFKGGVSVKDMIESLGAPHTEVDLILVNGRPVDFSYLVAAGDDFAVYPAFHSVDISPLIHLIPPPPQPARFVLDAHLGRLAAYLRLLGFDALYRNDFPDEELAAISSSQERILLTRDRGLLKRREVQHGYCLRTTVSRRQIIEVITYYRLFRQLAPFTHCVHCNGLLSPVPKEDVAERLLPHTRENYHDFHVCAGCGQIYWQGSHAVALHRLLADVREAEQSGRGDEQDE
jgi:uncharacterized protein